MAYRSGSQQLAELADPWSEPRTLVVVDRAQGRAGGERPTVWAHLQGASTRLARRLMTIAGVVTS